jgi:hypothetical protein
MRKRLGPVVLRQYRLYVIRVVGTNRGGQYIFFDAYQGTILGELKNFNGLVVQKFVAKGAAQSRAFAYATGPGNY